jgi:RNA polymerase sigma factor (sigma-70 family)
MTVDSSHAADRADMIALGEGDDLALNRLMTRWERPLRSFLFRSTQNEHTATDLAQESFVRVYQHRFRFREDAKFSTWLFQIAINLARDHARRSQHRSPIGWKTAPEGIDEHSPALALAETEKITAIRNAIAQLPGDFREALLLSTYEQKSHAEIAELVGASAKAVENRIYRARALLKKALVRFLPDGSN